MCQHGRGSTTYEVEDGSGNVVTARQTDWMVKVADYQFDDVAEEPKRGDTITSDGITYKVVRLGDRVFEYADSGRTWYRIHTIED